MKNEKLRDFLSRVMSADSRYMCIDRGGIRYIYEPVNAEISPAGEAAQTAVLVGISARGTFYSLSDKYAGVGNDYYEELQKFESLYDELLTEQMNKYSAKKPVGGRVSASVKLRLDEFQSLEVPTDSLLCDYVNSVSSGKNGGIMDKMDRLPKPEKDRILRIMDALVAAAR